MKHIKNLTLRAILSAVICVIAPFALPAGAIPITLASFIIFIVSACTGAKYSIPAISIYILLGCFGLPVFSGFCGGFQIITGITGGYIIGYLPCAAVISFLCKKYADKNFVFPLSMLLGTCLCYVCGAAWYIAQTKSSVAAALAVCIAPFILGDIIKISAASVISITLRPRFTKILNKY